LNDANLIYSVLSFLSDGEMAIFRSHQCNGNQEQAFGFSKTDRLELNSNDLPKLSVEVLEDILTRGSFSIVGEDDRLK
jgi:hypothetical protein